MQDNKECEFWVKKKAINFAGRCKKYSFVDMFLIITLLLILFNNELEYN